LHYQTNKISIIYLNDKILTVKQIQKIMETNETKLEPQKDSTTSLPEDSLTLSDKLQLSESVNAKLVVENKKLKEDLEQYRGWWSDAIDSRAALTQKVKSLIDMIGEMKIKEIFDLKKN
jgi:hypothetical protein